MCISSKFSGYTDLLVQEKLWPTALEDSYLILDKCFPISKNFPSQARLLCPLQVSLENRWIYPIQIWNKEKVGVNVVKSSAGARRRRMVRTVTFDVWCKWLLLTIGRTNPLMWISIGKTKTPPNRISSFRPWLFLPFLGNTLVLLFPWYLRCLLKLSNLAFQYSIYNQRNSSLQISSLWLQVTQVNVFSI